MNKLYIISCQSSRRSILVLSDLVRDDLQRGTHRNHALTVEQQVIVTLRFLARGSFLQVVGDTLGLDKGTVSRVVKDTTAALCMRQNEFIKWPKSDVEKNKIKAGNFRIGEFPNLIGVIDGTHVRIQAPTTDEASYVNRKGYHNINVQAVCDADGKFTNINTSWPGNAHYLHSFVDELPKDQEEEMPNIDAVYNGANDGRRIRDHITQMYFTH
ncbi:HARBI1 [Mytilus coruscus]|uniref:Putative nuclease HARBI1 n=1 Tax=Mytilus coruscus TaxID=42192 RepID=A0A6J8C5H7_MYTCO|nr:HARBI1 [Mytilus coruscus]